MFFAAYYCFNIQYPECVAATLEFIQRYAAFSFYSIKIIFSCAYYFFNSRRYFLSNIHIIHDDSHHIHAFLQDNSLSLSYLCRCIVTLNSGKGTKSSKAKGKVHNVNPKVLSFVYALKDFESEWKLP